VEGAVRSTRAALYRYRSTIPRGTAQSATEGMVTVRGAALAVLRDKRRGRVRFCNGALVHGARCVLERGA
jgi:hypothetical protein